MSSLFLSGQLIRNILRRALKQLFIRSSDNHNAPFSGIPPELLDRTIDHLHDDQQALLALARTSKQTLVRSRLHLIRDLEINHKKTGDRKFGKFLALVDAPWTSFTHAVESLHLKWLFYFSTRCKYFPKRNMARIIANLSNLKTLRLEKIYWPFIPPHIRDLFFQLDITDLQLDTIEFTTYKEVDIVELFGRLQPSIKSITLYNLQFEDDPISDLSHNSLIFRRPFVLKSLDTYSLLLFKDVWDPLSYKDLDIAVESFHIRLIPMLISNIEAYSPFISRFLRKVGPSIRHVVIKVSDPYISEDCLSYYDSIDLSHCISVRSVHVTTITLDQLSRSGKQLLPMMSTMWNSLSTLPTKSPSVEEILLVFGLSYATLDVTLAELETFAWLDLATRLQDMFPNLKTITVGLGYYSWDVTNVPSFVEALRRSPGMQELEEKGVVVLQMIPWHHGAHPEWEDDSIL